MLDTLLSRRSQWVHGFASSRPPAAGYHPQDRDQDHRADEGHEDARDVDAVDGIRDLQQRCGQEAADHGAHDAHDDVADEAVAAPAHHLAGQPTSDQPNDDPRQNTHGATFPFSERRLFPPTTWKIALPYY